MHADVTRGAQGLKLLLSLRVTRFSARLCTSLFQIQSSSPSLTPGQGLPLPGNMPRSHTLSIAGLQNPPGSAWQGALAPHFTDEETEGSASQHAFRAAGASWGRPCRLVCLQGGASKGLQPARASSSARSGRAWRGAADSPGELAAWSPDSAPRPSVGRLSSELRVRAAP